MQYRDVSCTFCGKYVEGLYCKRPIQCLASSELLTPHPPHGPASVYPPPLVRGEDTLAGWRGGGGSLVRKTPDTALYSIYVSTLWVNITMLPAVHSFTVNYTKRPEIRTSGKFPLMVQIHRFLTIGKADILTMIIWIDTIGH
jgi:hypothetical protein